jgi:hypothetical protein
MKKSGFEFEDKRVYYIEPLTSPFSGRLAVRAYHHKYYATTIWFDTEEARDAFLKEKAPCCYETHDEFKQAWDEEEI